jgi:hypothetical protein
MLSPMKDKETVELKKVEVERKNLTHQDIDTYFGQNLLTKFQAVDVW